MIKLYGIQTLLVSTSIPKVHKKLISFQKGTDIESSTIINDKIIDDNNKSEEISSNKNSAELIDHTRYDNGEKLTNTEEKSDVTSIWSCDLHPR